MSKVWFARLRAIELSSTRERGVGMENRTRARLRATENVQRRSLLMPEHLSPASGLGRIVGPSLHAYACSFTLFVRKRTFDSASNARRDKYGAPNGAYEHAILRGTDSPCVSCVANGDEH